MFTYILKRLLQTIPVILILSMLVFGLTFLVPGDPVTALLGPGINRSAESVEQAREELGLNNPVPVQYVNWLSGALRGDLGRSTSTGQPVGEALLRRIPVTAELALFSVLLSIVIALPLGVIAAVHRNSVWDIAASFLSILGLALPNFWLAILLIFFFAVRLGWLPASGHVSVFESPVEGIRHMLLPAIALSGGSAAALTRYIRSSMLEVLRNDYIRTAYAKGLTSQTVVVRHALKNAMIPVVTVIGIQLGLLMGGSLIVESIFLVPGVGSMMVNAIFTRDFPIIQAGALILATLVLLINLFVDILYGFLDPRIRYG